MDGESGSLLSLVKSKNQEETQGKEKEGSKRKKRKKAQQQREGQSGIWEGQAFHTRCGVRAGHNTVTEFLCSIYQEPTQYVALRQAHRDPSLTAARKEQGPPTAKSYRPCSEEGVSPSRTLSAASNNLDPRVREMPFHLGSGHHRCLAFPPPPAAPSQSPFVSYVRLCIP